MTDRRDEQMDATRLEIEAMQNIAEALAPLSSEARQRALQWAFSLYRTNKGGEGQIVAATVVTSSEGNSENASFRTFAELFDAAHPTVERDKALIAAYWMQVCEGYENFQAQSLNAELKNLGHGVGNITDALTQLRDERPALILQLKKSGTSQQARKTYKITAEGIKRVQMLMNQV